jgi:hypothetical protein
MPLQTSGAISLSQIQSEFGGSNPISLSEYYRNGSYVNSNSSNIPTSGQIKFSNFYGAQAQASVPSPQPSSLPSRVGGVGNTSYEIVTGLYANNTSRSEGTTTFDHRGGTSRGSSNDVKYPSKIIQAKAGDTLTLISRLNTSSSYNEYAEFYVWLGGSWIDIGHPNATFTGNRDFTISYTIPSGTSPGNYGLAVGLSYSTYQSSSYRSWKSYSLHVWG